MNGRRSIAPRREWNDRHFMNRVPSPIELSAASGERRRSAPPPQGPQLGPAPAPVPAPAEVTLRPNMAARAQEVRSLPIGTSPLAAGTADTRRRPPLRAAHASPHAPIPISAKVRAITTLRINYSCCYLKIFECDAERSQPAARADTELHTRTASPLRGD